MKIGGDWSRILKVGRRNEIADREEERHAGVGEDCHKLTSGMSVACSKVSEGLAGWREHLQE